MSTPALLSARGIRKRFGPTLALDGVDIDAYPGEALGLVGENGAGKSTLMKVLSGALPPDQGEMRLGGQPYAPGDPHAARRAGVCMVYQELSIAPHLTVAENVLLGAEPLRAGLLDRRALREKATRALGALGHGDIDPSTRAGDLPPALRQVVEIARALAVGCRVLILDEPTSSLGQDDIGRLFRLLGELKRQGLALLTISHFLEEVRQTCERVTILRDGRSVHVGPLAAIADPDIATLMAGRPVDQLYPRSARARGPLLLDLKGLSGVGKPENADLAVHRGEVVGIAGLVGAGRTELLRAIFGLAPIRSGSLRVGLHEGPASPSRRWRQGVGLVSEDRKAEGLAPSLSTAENIGLPSLPFLLSPRREREAAGRWMDKLRIRAGGPGQPVSGLSGGNQQKVALARLLERDCDLFLLDEPTRGIDIASKAEIYRLIDTLAAKGKAVLMVSSYLPELFGVCDRIAVMCRGRLCPARAVSDTDPHRVLLEATAADPDGGMA